MGSIAHAESMTSWKRCFIPGTDGVVVGDVGQGLLPGPTKRVNQTGVGRSKIEVRVCCMLCRLRICRERHQEQDKPSEPTLVQAWQTAPWSGVKEAHRILQSDG